jgi:hypothetical protein
MIPHEHYKAHASTPPDRAALSDEPTTTVSIDGFPALA